MSKTHVQKSSSSPRILVVDDEPRSLELFSILLRRDGHDVFTATSGMEAERLIERNQYDLVIMDVRMPGMNGHEALTRIRRLPDRADLPVVFVSGYAEPGSAVAAFKAGGCDFLAKPVDGEELLARVRAQLGKRE
jgi:DNA-binding response OmpR family regulator